MSRTNQPIAIDSEDPVYYAELLSLILRPANRHSPHKPSCPDIPSIQPVDGPLTQRIRTLLDIVADISLCGPGNVSATMAQLRQDKKGILETQLYIVFNHEDDTVLHCTEHLASIF